MKRSPGITAVLLMLALMLSGCDWGSHETSDDGDPVIDNPDDGDPGDGDPGHWELVGGSLNVPWYDNQTPPQPVTTNADRPVLVSANGSLYACFRQKELNSAYRYSEVLKLEGSAWTLLGDRMAQDPHMTGTAYWNSHSLAVSSSGDMYLCAVREGLVMMTYRYNAATAAWVEIQDVQGRISGTCVWPQLLFKGSTLYMIMDSYTGNFEIYAYSFDAASSTWLQAGNDKINAATTITMRKPRMALGGDSKLHAAFIEGNKVYVKRLDGDDWVQEGASLNVDPEAYAFEVDITCVGATPYVAWNEINSLGDNRFRLFVKHFDGTKWVADGGELNIVPGSTGREPRIVSDGTRPYVAWAEDAPLAVDKKIYVKHLEAGAWVQDGDSLNIVATALANEPQIAFLGATPYVAWFESGQMYVKRLVK